MIPYTGNDLELSFEEIGKIIDEEAFKYGVDYDGDMMPIIVNGEFKFIKTNFLKMHRQDFFIISSTIKPIVSTYQTAAWYVLYVTAQRKIAELEKELKELKNEQCN